ncbi:MAG TPA: adenosylcobinamide amidohydrolase [Streptosporangiaceae bacterium]
MERDAGVELAERVEDGRTLAALVWRAGPRWRMISTGIVGGGLGERRWVLNAQVPGGYARMDPVAHLAEIAAPLGLSGPGVGLLTAADVRRRASATDGGVRAVATVGVGTPAWAAVPWSTPPEAPGTINILVTIPAALADAALVNLIATATEAKVQALQSAGHAATGTPTDAICIAAHTSGPSAPFGGPRSHWGSRAARAVHRAVHDGATTDPHRPPVRT